MKATFLLMLLTIAPVQAQVLHLGTGKALELASTSVNLSGGRTLVVYETLTVVNSSVTGVRLSTCLLHDGRADANHPMESLNQQPLVGSPAGLVVDGKPYLYFVSAASEEAVPSLERVLVHDDGSVGQPETLPPIFGLEKAFSLPRFQPYGGGFAVAFRDRHTAPSQPMLALSKDGQHFGAPVGIGPKTGAQMPNLARLGAHGLAFTYQTNDKDGMVSWVRTSPNGVDWSTPVRVSESSDNVHDTSLLARADGSADLYYAYTSNIAGSTSITMFQIYRRRLFPDGRLGAEQRVTPESVEDAMKPFPSRLANGKVLLCFVQGLERSGGFPVRERVDALVLDRDAP